MTTLEPGASAIAKRDPDTDQYPPNYGSREPPAVKKLWKSIRWLFALNTLLAVATFSQAYFAYRANELTRAAVTETVEANRLAKIALERERLSGIEGDKRAVAQDARAERQLKLSKDSADATNKNAVGQLAAQREALQVEQRAWVSFTDYQMQSREPPPKGASFVLREPKFGDEFSVRIGLKNTGRTPALRSTSNIVVLVQPNAPANPPNWDGMTWGPASIVFPDDAGRFIESKPYAFRDQASAQAYRDGKVIAWIFARTYYCDVNGRRHFTDTCAQHRFTADVTTALTEFRFCGGGVDPGAGESGHPYCK